MSSRRGIIFILLALVALLPACQKKRSPGSENFFNVLYIAKTSEPYTRTKAAFAAWLRGQGLDLDPFPGKAPGGAFYDIETGDHVTLYTRPVGDNLLLLRLVTNDTKKKIRAVMFYKGTFTPQERAEMKRRNVALWMDMLDWMKSHGEDNTYGTEPAKDSQIRAMIKNSYFQ